MGIINKFGLGLARKKIKFIHNGLCVIYCSFVSKIYFNKDLKGYVYESQKGYCYFISLD